jgi:alginate O-acetyltransferase complex protein AlgI
MLFNSLPYLLFLPVVVTVYYWLSLRQRQWFLLFASLFFYSFWALERSKDWGQRAEDLFLTVGLLLITTVVDYNIARWLARETDQSLRKRILWISIVCNLAILATFKYANFLRASIEANLGFTPWPYLDAVLPPGISFYTFMSMAYVIDVYRRELDARDKLLDFSVFVAYFPHLVAGPILRAKQLLPQMTVKQPLDWRNIRRGLAIIYFGMFIKVCLADPMGHLVNEVYGNTERASGFGLLMATYAFAVQIYCDFAGYSAIAIGSALMLGVRLPENFRTPYLSLSITEFWRRWHISLSTWLRDYLYIPLGGNRKGKARTYLNLFTTMLLGGIWHGAGWHWMIWGGIHGLWLTLEKALGIKEQHPRSFPLKVVRWAVTFHVVLLSWVFFRAHDAYHAFEILGKIFTMAPGEDYYGLKPLGFVALMLLLDAVRAERRWVEWISNRPVLLTVVTYVALVVLALTFMGASNPEFIYFAF